MLAIFSFRYDAHLVPGLIENISPMVDGWVSWDDRGSSEIVSNDRDLRFRLLDAAHEAGADWILRVDPDERFEPALAERMDRLTRVKLPIVWMFRLRELYAPDAYRVDGLWGEKRQGRLFPVFDFLFPSAASGHFRMDDFHSESFPTFYWRRATGLNLYHLKMIAPQRRRHRRDLYAALDPGGRFQDVGYDYLTDEAGAVFEQIPEGRSYRPPHVEDDGLWMPPTLPSGTEPSS